MVGAMAAPTVAEYLLQQLQKSGVDHVFGVPGDYVLGFYKILADSPLQHIGTTREDTSAFAADGYARCRGIGALAVTYGVGALNVVNAFAGAHAESSPVVVISGAPLDATGGVCPSNDLPGRNAPGRSGQNAAQTG